MSFYRIKWKSLLVLTLIIITMTHLLPVYSEISVFSENTSRFLTIPFLIIVMEDIRILS